MSAAPPFVAALSAGAVPFLPSKIANLIDWYEADRESGYVDGDALGTIVSQVNGGTNLTQATAAKKPTFKTDIVNGKPVFRFDGADDVVSATVANYRGSDADGTLAFIAKARVAHFGYVWASGDTSAGTSAGGMGLELTGGAKLTTRVQQSAGADNLIDTTMTSATFAGSFRVVILRARSADYSVRIDGTEEVLSAITGANDGQWLSALTDRDNITMGAIVLALESGRWDGDIACLCYYSRALSDAECQTFERKYAQQKYGINIA